MESEYLSNMFYDLYKHSSDDYKKTVNINDKRVCKEYQLRICHAYKYVHLNQSIKIFSFSSV
jgi:hypothetical protein